MSSLDTNLLRVRTLITVGCVLLFMGVTGAQEGYAQFDQKPMAIGDLHMVYTATGGQQEYYNQGPNHMELDPEFQDGLLRADALWIGAKDVEGKDGTQYDRRVVHVGPRTTGFGEYFPVEFTKTVRYEPPTVTVDGNETLKEGRDFDEVDSNLPSDQMIEIKSHTLLGVTLTKRIYAWTQGAHDSYHVQEYVLENTGHASAEEEGALEGQTAEDVYLHFQKRYTHQSRSSIPGQEWGANVVNDIVGDGQENYDVDFAAQYTWNGNSPGAGMDPLGGPAWNDSPWFLEDGDDQGELTTTQFVGTVKLYAPESPDKPRQPSMTGHIDADHPITSGNSAFNEQMNREYRFMSTAERATDDYELGDGSHHYPHHADIADQDGDFTTVMGEGDPKLGKAGGYTSAFSYGPYDLEPGESVRIVIAEGVASLSKDARVEIGQAFKATANGGDEGATDAFDPIEYDANGNGTIEPDEEMGKNEWVMTGRDSLFQTFERAIANFDASSGADGALESYAIPQPPAPPSEFSVESGVDEVSLSWARGSDPPGGFEIYRARGRVVGQYEDNYQYERIATVDGSTREYSDTEVTRGAQYFYYIQAVGNENTNSTGMTPTGKPLKSNRYQTQTWDPASLKRGPGESVADFQIVPNPYNVSADQDVRWDQQDRLGFLDIPGNCIIRIYTEMGELVETIRHEDGSGDEFWDHTTADRQLVASGLYIAVVEDLDTGQVEKKKFVIVR